MKTKHLLVFTDIGDDIDDSLALCHLMEHTQYQLCAVVASHGNIDGRIAAAQELFTYFDAPPPLIPGDRIPFSTGQTSIDSHRLVHKIKTYLPHDEKVTILCLCAATDLANLLLIATELQDQIETIRYQGVITKTQQGLIPDLDSYNFKTDAEAIAFCLAQNIPCKWITKHDAYKHPFRKEDFLSFTQKPDLNEYLLSKANERQARFKILNHAKRKEIYGSDPTILSYPYDLLVAQQV